MIDSFSISRVPRIFFGSGTLARLPAIIGLHGRRFLLVTGAHSFLASAQWQEVSARLSAGGFTWHTVRVAGEPSPDLVDDSVKELSPRQFDAVVGIGGGSALDAAKAIAGLLIPGNSVRDHLEGVGPGLPYRGPATPFIAVPTTAGTGSEATKNAVLSVHGEHGYKKSFRDDKLVAEYALIDPELLASCPPAVLAANGMDAFTQLLESYVSSRANPFTDALAWSGMEAARDSLLPWYEGSGDPVPCRSGMAYAALLSGITLAQVGLGAVHGLAAPLGAFFPIPHGVVCGTLVAAAARVNIDALRQRQPDSPALAKYAAVGRLLCRQPNLPFAEALDQLLASLADWTRRLNLPPLSAYGVTKDDVGRLVANGRGSSMKTNPVVLTDAEVGEIVATRI